MNRLEAKRHWNTRTAEWKTWAESFAKDVNDIEDPTLRHCVASILDCCASGFGHVLVRREEPSKIHLVQFALMPEFRDALQRGVQSLNPEVDFPMLQSQAEAWIKTRLKSTNAVQVAWIIGPLRDVSPYDKDSLKTIAIDHIVYDVKDGHFVGVKFDDGIYKVVGV